MNSMNRRAFLRTSALAGAALAAAPGAAIASVLPAPALPSPWLSLPLTKGRSIDQVIALLKGLMGPGGYKPEQIAYSGPWENITPVIEGVFGDWKNSPRHFSTLDNACWRLIPREYCVRFVSSTFIFEDPIGKRIFKGGEMPAEIQEYNRERLQACKLQDLDRRLRGEIGDNETVKLYETAKWAGKYVDHVDLLEYAFWRGPMEGIKVAVHEVPENATPLERAAFRQLYRSAQVMVSLTSDVVPG